MQDQFLDSLIAVVNKTPVNYSITLATSGGLIRGTLISNQEYFDRFADSFVKAWPADGGETMRESFTQWGQTDASDGFIHLKDANFFEANGACNQASKFLWRGKLADVVGFTLGQG